MPLKDSISTSKTDIRAVIRAHRREQRWGTRPDTACYHQSRLSQLGAAFEREYEEVSQLLEDARNMAPIVDVPDHASDARRDHSGRAAL